MTQEEFKLIRVGARLAGCADAWKDNQEIPSYVREKMREMTEKWDAAEAEWRIGVALAAYDNGQST